jgi:lipopolysaccharide export system permease protein
MTMRILDRQRFWAILLAYLKAYVICFVTLVGLYVVLDAFANLDKHFQVAGSKLDLLSHMGGYYVRRISDISATLCGVVGVIAAIFAVDCKKKDDKAH